MAKIDTSKWKSVAIGSIFNVVKGTRLTKANMIPGLTRFIGSSAMNNGCTALIGNDKNIHPQNTITVCYNGSVGETFYQDEPFWASDDVNVLYPKFEMNKEIALFIVPLIKSASHKYTYIDKWKREDMIADKIKLPVCETGEIDWEFMESYMKNVLNESLKNIENIRQIENKRSKLNISEWKDFIIGDLFDKIVKPDVLHSRQVVECENGIPYVVRTKFNNGIKCYVQKKKNMNLSPGGVISFGAENATFFYQDRPFVSGRDIYYIDTQHLSAITCRFLTACLQPIARKYSYNNGLFPELLKKEIIKLPVCKGNEKPDWEYMEQYMQEMTTAAESVIENLEMFELTGV